MQPDVKAIQDKVQRESESIDLALYEIGKVIVGQKTMIERVLISLLTGGHVLLEGVPGLAKTLAIRTITQAISAKFQRIQFTPDLLPADLVGTVVYNQQQGTFTPKKGPIFTNLLLADEINRAPAKVQSALLEAMQERQVTLGGETMPLPSPFLVLGTENPIEQEGTYPLPEAQVDRFMLKLMVDYPTVEEERKILDTMAFTAPEMKIKPVIPLEEVVRTRQVVDGIHVHDSIRDYIVRVVFATRQPQNYNLDLRHFIQFGASPRATINLTLASKAWALLQGRSYVTPQDIKDIGPDVLRHRIILTYEAEAQGMTSDAIIKKIFDTIPVP